MPLSLDGIGDEDTKGGGTELRVIEVMSTVSVCICGDWSWEWIPDRHQVLKPSGVRRHEIHKSLSDVLLCRICFCVQIVSAVLFPSAHLLTSFSCLLLRRENLLSNTFPLFPLLLCEVLRSPSSISLFDNPFDASPVPHSGKKSGRRKRKDKYFVLNFVRMTASSSEWFFDHRDGQSLSNGGDERKGISPAGEYFTLGSLPRRIL